MKTRLILIVLLLATLGPTVGCVKKEVIVKGIPDAENATFTTDGRLFVTGEFDIYEVQYDGTAYVLEDRYDKTCYFTGVKQVGDYLYTLCIETAIDPLDSDCNLTSIGTMINCVSELFTDRFLLRGRIIDENGQRIDEPKFEKILQLHDLTLPNGLAADSQGRLYIADSPYLPMGKIIRVDLNQEPLVAETWLSPAKGAFSPNGMAILGNTLYFTDYDMTNLLQHKAAVKKVNILGDDPGTVRRIYETTGGFLAPYSLFDDLTVREVEGRIIVAVVDFNNGDLLFFEDTNQQKSKPDRLLQLQLQNPSSVIVGSEPMFRDTELVVTEKGVMFVDPYSDYGNGLVKISFPNQ